MFNKTKPFWVGISAKLIQKTVLTISLLISNTFDIWDETHIMLHENQDLEQKITVCRKKRLFWVQNCHFLQ